MTTSRWIGVAILVAAVIALIITLSVANSNPCADGTGLSTETLEIDCHPGADLVAYT
jgi:hypothetical protein